MNLHYFVAVFWIILGHLSSSKASLRGRCSECLPNGIACLDEHTFAPCFKGTISNRSVMCPAGSYCTDHKKICSTQMDGRLPVCRYNNCGSCSPRQGQHFTCLSETSFSVCYGDGLTTPAVEYSIRQCPSGYVCNSRQGEELCWPENDTMPSCTPGFDNGQGKVPEMPTTEIPSPSPPVTATGPETITSMAETTAAAAVNTDSTTGADNAAEETTTSKIAIDPGIFCNNKKAIGNFKDATDKSCKHYFFCFFLSGQYLGYRLECRNYFDAETSKCQDRRPEDCV